MLGRGAWPKRIENCWVLLQGIDATLPHPLCEAVTTFHSSSRLHPVNPSALCPHLLDEVQGSAAGCLACLHQVHQVELLRSCEHERERERALRVPPQRGVSGSVYCAPHRRSWTRTPWLESPPRALAFAGPQPSESLRVSAFSGDDLMVSHVRGPKPFMYLLMHARQVSCNRRLREGHGMRKS